METYTNLSDPRYGFPVIPYNHGKSLAELRQIPCPFDAQWETIDSTGWLWRWESFPQWSRSCGEYLWSDWGFGKSQCVGKVRLQDKRFGRTEIRKKVVVSMKFTLYTQTMGYSTTKMNKDTIRGVYPKLVCTSCSKLPVKKPRYNTIDREVDVSDKETDTMKFMVIVYQGREWYELELPR